MFISNRIKTYNFSNGICFKIDRVKGEDETFDAGKTLKEDDVHDGFSKSDTNSEPAEFYGRGRKRGHEETSEHTNRRTRKSVRFMISFRTITRFKKEQKQQQQRNIATQK